MFMIHRSRSLFLGSAAFLALALFAPGVVNADEAIPVTAPVAGPATDAVPVIAPVAAPSVDDTSALAAERALLSGDIGSLQEEHLLAIVAAAPSWNETSGYGSVEATRALAAERALLSGDIGSMQEDRLLAIVAAAPSWDETSGYSAVEASRAANALLAPVAGPSWDETSGYASVEASRAIIGHPVASTTLVSSDVRWAPAGTIAPDSSIEVRHTVSPDYLPVALARGTRAESAVLWSILHQDAAVSVNPSDDRIGAALFADEPRGEDATVAVLHRTQR